MKYLCFVIKLGKFPCSWIRIRIGNADPDLGEPNKCGSMHIRIHNSSSYNTENRNSFLAATEWVNPASNQKVKKHERQFLGKSKRKFKEEIDR
jgi:hypothetical protein